MMIGTYKVSDLANVFPEIEGADFEEFMASIQEKGLQEPITLNGNGEVLDGRNRLRACLASGVEPDFEVFDGDRDAQISFVEIRNIMRRNLSASQRAMVVASMLHARGVGPGDEGASVEALNKLSEQASVSPGTVRAASKVVRDAPENVQEEVKKGNIAASAAAEEFAGRESVSTAEIIEFKKGGRPKGNAVVYKVRKAADAVNQLAAYDLKKAAPHAAEDDVRAIDELIGRLEAFRQFIRESQGGKGAKSASRVA